MSAREQVLHAISRNVRAERLKAGISQSVLAKKTGLSVRYISRLETTPQDIRIGKLCLIAKTLGIEPGRLLDPGPIRDRKTSLEVAEDVATIIRLLQRVQARVS